MARTTVAKMAVAVSAQTAQFQKGMKESQKSLRGFKDAAKGTGSSLEDLNQTIGESSKFKKIIELFAGAGAIAGVKVFGDQLAKSAGEMRKFADNALMAGINWKDLMNNMLISLPLLGSMIKGVQDLSSAVQDLIWMTTRLEEVEKRKNRQQNPGFYGWFRGITKPWQSTIFPTLSAMAQVFLGPSKSLRDVADKQLKDLNKTYVQKGVDKGIMAGMPKAAKQVHALTREFEDLRAEFIEADKKAMKATAAFGLTEQTVARASVWKAYQGNLKDLKHRWLSFWKDLSKDTIKQVKGMGSALEGSQLFRFLQFGQRAFREKKKVTFAVPQLAPLFGSTTEASLAIYKTRAGRDKMVELVQIQRQALTRQSTQVSLLDKLVNGWVQVNIQ